MKYKYDYTLISKMGLPVYEETTPPVEKMTILSVEEIKNLRDASSLVQCLKNAGAKLDESALAFLQEQEIFGEDFLALTLDALKTYELKLGPAGRILRIIDKIQKREELAVEAELNVNYTSGTDSEVENMTTGVNSLTMNDNVDSPSRKAPTGKLLRKLCKGEKILIGDILRYEKEGKSYDCRVEEFDRDKTPSFSFTYNGQEHKGKYSDLEPLLRWVLSIFTGKSAPSLKDIKPILSALTRKSEVLKLL